MGNMHYKMLRNVVGETYTKNICDYLQEKGTDRILIPAKYKMRSNLSDILPESIFKKLVTELGGMRLRPVEITESDRLRITQRAVSILEKELTEDEIALVLQRSVRTIRYAYRYNKSEDIHQSQQQVKQMSLFD
ncbi:hypothetical protein L3V82_03565 [Thiotrichales bacterium 19S3-7]|nr:hypothetical protein [Thiotrichales bacterium 19S3-7]MCF6801275.1 hypothetical protein [Thiotrichales bacterium 19S3-11]